MGKKLYGIHTSSLLNKDNLSDQKAFSEYSKLQKAEYVSLNLKSVDSQTADKQALWLKVRITQLFYGWIDSIPTYSVEYKICDQKLEDQRFNLVTEVELLKLTVKDGKMFKWADNVIDKLAAYFDEALVNQTEFQAIAFCRVFNFYTTNHAIGQGAITKLWHKIHKILNLPINLQTESSFLYDLVHPIGVRAGLLGIYGLTWSGHGRKVHEACIPTFLKRFSMFQCDAFSGIRKDVLPAGTHKISFITGCFRIIAQSDIRVFYPDMDFIKSLMKQYHQVANHNVGYHTGANYLTCEQRMKQVGNMGSAYDVLANINDHITNCSYFMKILYPNSTICDSPIFNKGVGATSVWAKAVDHVKHAAETREGLIKDVLEQINVNWSGGSSIVVFPVEYFQVENWASEYLIEDTKKKMSKFELKNLGIKGDAGEKLQEG